MVDYIRDATGFPGIAMILRVDLEIRRADGTTSIETRYFITSLGADQTSPERLLRFIRDHWSVENRLHFVKDRWWDEDRQWSRRPGLAERLAMMRDAALAALRLFPEMPAKFPIRARADRLGRSLPMALNFIGASI